MMKNWKLQLKLNGSDCFVFGCSGSNVAPNAKNLEDEMSTGVHLQPVMVPMVCTTFPFRVSHLLPWSL